jgi:molybdate transport system permease protein
MWIERLGLAGLERRFPEELSGGQQRRVAIARALATAPRVLLLDEPFAGLDAPVRGTLRRELRRLQHECALSTVLVTHDATDAALLADDLIVLREGRVLQAGARARVMAAPASPTIAALLGITNVNHGCVASASSLTCAGHEIRTRDTLPQAGTEVIWSVRPEHVALPPDGPLEAELLDDADLGGVHELTLQLGAGVELIARTTHPPTAYDGGPVRLELAAEHVDVWPAPTAGGDKA